MKKFKTITKKRVKYQLTLIFLVPLCQFIQRMVNRLLFISVLVLLSSCSACHQNKSTSPGTPQERVDSLPMLVTQIQKCSKLYTTEYHVHKIITHSDVVNLKGSFLSKKFDLNLPLGDRKIAIPLDVTLKAYIDFSGFDSRQVVKQGNHITITLPDPKVVLTSSKIDHQGIKEYVSLTRAHFSDAEMSNYEQQGRASVLANMAKMGILESARENAARVLVPMLVQMGYQDEQVTIVFRKRFTENDLPLLIDQSTEQR